MKTYLHTKLYLFFSTLCLLLLVFGIVKTGTLLLFFVVGTGTNKD